MTERRSALRYGDPVSIAAREHARGKAERRRRLQVRQTLIFGTLILMLGLIFLIAFLQWQGSMESPFAREFTTEDVPHISDTLACPSEGMVTVAAEEITATVLNSTARGGLATAAADQLTLVGVHIVAVGNWDESVLQGPGVIEVGPGQIAEGYSLQYLLPGMPVMQVDTVEEGATVVLGVQFQAVADASTLQPDQPIAIPEECLAGGTGQIGAGGDLTGEGTVEQPAPGN